MTSTDGIIEEVWGGNPGEVILLIPKDTETLYLGSGGSIGVTSDFIGDLVTNLTAVIDIAECDLLKSADAPNTTQLVCDGATITSVSALKVLVLNCIDCDSLTGQSIYDVLDNAYKLGQGGMVDGIYSFGGSTTAIDLATISQRHGISYDAIITYLTGDPNWTITVNEE